MSRVRYSLIAPILFLLSCSHAGQALRNDEFGIEARFPSGLVVCTALSGANPVGFFSWLDRTTRCDVPAPPAASRVSITADYNAMFDPSPALSGCSDGETPRGLDIALDGLAFSGMRSVSCALQRSDGSLEIFVAAQGGTNAGADLAPRMRAAPAINYHAWLRTRRERLDTDLRALREILANSRIKPRTVGN